jgi:hypothetical protein
MGAVYHIPSGYSVIGPNHRPHGEERATAARVSNHVAIFAILRDALEDDRSSG